MAKTDLLAHELIRRLMDGRNMPAARRGLVRLGGDAVEPVLEALAGDHGDAHSDVDATSELLNVLVAIAKDDAKPLAAAMAHDTPCLNAVVWALGHSSTRHAISVMKDLQDHGDTGVTAVAAYHLRRRRKAPGSAAKPRPAKKKAAKKKAAKKKASSSKRKKATKKKAKRRAKR